jgi:exodeoxyribonuclease-1
MRFSQKAAIADYILAEPIFCLSDFYFGTPYSWLVTVIGANADNHSEFYVYNLLIEPESLINLSDEELFIRLSLSPKPVRRLRSNACPIIVPMEDAPAIATAAQLGTEELSRRTEFLHAHEEFRARLIETFQSTREEPIVSPHLERQLYDGFFPRGDEPLMERFHLVPWDDRPAIVTAFKDRRLKKIGQRLIYLERPDLLSVSVRSQYDQAIAARIGKDDPEVPWLTLPQALADLDELLAEAAPLEILLLREYRAHLANRMESAVLTLKAPAGGGWRSANPARSPVGRSPDRFPPSTLAHTTLCSPLIKGNLRLLLRGTCGGPDRPNHRPTIRVHASSIK